MEQRYSGNNGFVQLYRVFTVPSPQDYSICITIILSIHGHISHKVESFLPNWSVGGQAQSDIWAMSDIHWSTSHHIVCHFHPSVISLYELVSFKILHKLWASFGLHACHVILQVGPIWPNDTHFGPPHPALIWSVSIQIWQKKYHVPTCIYNFRWV